ncbi:MAG: CPBP family intramembrane metalloprotease [Lachnospiraceae bacterium]|nr:CPBP family intramembrane metalloprotease [Lachnospiraceae bacterium]
MKDKISIVNGVFWTFIWFGFMLFYTFLDIYVWRDIAPTYEKYLNLISIVLCIIAFLALIIKKKHLKIDLFGNISCHKILLSVSCAVLFYFLLDKCLDPIFEGIFPLSEESYQDELYTLAKTPVISLIQICILAPFIEEFLMRGFLLDGLTKNYGKRIALFVSALLFALLHFNMVQTLSAFICGIILGLLYFYTNSLFCCIITHIGYNLISYILVILPLIRGNINV